MISKKKCSEIFNKRLLNNSVPIYKKSSAWMIDFAWGLKYLFFWGSSYWIFTLVVTTKGESWRKYAQLLPIHCDNVVFFMTFQSLKGASEFGHFCSYSLNFQLSQWLFLAIFDDNLPKPDFFIAFQSLSGANEFGHFCLYLLDWQSSQWLFFGYFWW